MRITVTPVRLVAGQQRVLDRAPRRATAGSSEKCRLTAPCGGEAQHLAREELAVGDHHEDVGRRVERARSGPPPSRDPVDLQQRQPSAPGRVGDRRSARSRRPGPPAAAGS